MCAGSIEYAIVRDRVIAIDASEMQVCAHCLGIDCICTGDRSAGSMHICRIESSCVRDRMCTGSSHTPACGIQAGARDRELRRASGRQEGMYCTVRRALRLVWYCTVRRARRVVPYCTVRRVVLYCTVRRARSRGSVGTVRTRMERRRRELWNWTNRDTQTASRTWCGRTTPRPVP